MVNLNFKGIQKKIMDKADYIAFLAGVWERFNGDTGAIINHYTSFSSEHGFLMELQRNLTNVGSLRWSLWDSPHLYTSLFKIAAALRLGVELGLIPSKYKKALEKVLVGTGIGAITLPGHAPHETPNPTESAIYSRSVVAPNQTGYSY